MALVPALDLKSGQADPADHIPANVDAEQCLLGMVLYDNAALEKVGDRLRSIHFFEPFHQRLFGVMAGLIEKGGLAEPILLAERFARDPAFEELGGVRYLADLVDRAPPSAWAGQYAQTIYDLAIRRELIRIAGEVGMAAADPANEDSAAEQVETAEGALYGLAETGEAQGGLKPFSEALAGAVAMAAEAHSRDGGLAGISTGLLDLDRKIGGLHRSDLVIIAARPGMGKSALAVNIAYDVARHYAYEVQPDGRRKTTAGGRVAFFSLEMSQEQLALRVLSEVAGVNGDRIRKGEIDFAEFGRIRDAAVEINEVPLHTDATGGISLGRLAARARRMKRQGGLDLIVVDYLQLITVEGGGKADNRVQEVSAITGGLKALAKALDVPVIALAQLSRKVEDRADKKPQLADLRESGSIEQDADMVMFIYREAYYLGLSEPKVDTPEHLTWQDQMDQAAGQAELIIGKQRHGPIGTIRLAFNEDLTKFGNLARESHYPAPGPGFRQPHGQD